jgi:lysophospholipase L1-like esterase
MERIRALLRGDAPVRWVFAGDSITHGAAHTIGWRDYTELFSERVRWELRRTRDVVIKTGISGWTITELEADLDWIVLQFRPECVSLMFGMNDCKHGPDSIPSFREAYTRVIERIRTETEAAVLLHTPNWILATADEARLTFLPAYREAILKVATETDTPCVDHFPIWQEADAGGAMHHWLADGCHPNEYGHRVFAHTLFRALEIWDPSSWTCQLITPQLTT